MIKEVEPYSEERHIELSLEFLDKLTGGWQEKALVREWGEIADVSPTEPGFKRVIMGRRVNTLEAQILRSYNSGFSTESQLHDLVVLNEMSVHVDARRLREIGYKGIKKEPDGSPKIRDCLSVLSTAYDLRATFPTQIELDVGLTPNLRDIIAKQESTPAVREAYQRAWIPTFSLIAGKVSTLGDLNISDISDVRKLTRWQRNIAFFSMPEEYESILRDLKTKYEK